jgi:hypothetical protein
MRMLMVGIGFFYLRSINLGTYYGWAHEFKVMLLFPVWHLCHEHEQTT